ncbi:MAG: hypothetical protein LAT68_15455 [Cyclobacteriaceae bacterium]|nr:hypothetical protein [Cyclobacteriaceae bacterium]
MSWWRDVQGRNLLKGVPGDPDNPPLISEEWIIDFLARIPAARLSFNAVLPTLLPEEQERLLGILDRNPFLKKGVRPDPTDQNDLLQNRANRAGVYVVGKYGGTRWGG